MATNKHDSGRHHTGWSKLTRLGAMVLWKAYPLYIGTGSPVLCLPLPAVRRGVSCHISVLGHLVLGTVSHWQAHTSRSSEGGPWRTLGVPITDED